MLYNLKQVLYKLYFTLILYLINLKYKCFKYNYCIFYLKNSIIIAIFVDILFMLYFYLIKICNLKKKLGNKFYIKDMRPVL